MNELNDELQPFSPSLRPSRRPSVASDGLNLLDLKRPEELAFKQDTEPASVATQEQEHSRVLIDLQKQLQEAQYNQAQTDAWLAGRETNPPHAQKMDAHAETNRLRGSDAALLVEAEEEEEEEEEEELVIPTERREMYERMFDM